jgi:hypothetical protein
MATNTTTQLHQELNQARSDFRRTADEIRHNLESGQSGLNAEVRGNPLKSIAIAGALGFFLGRVSRPASVMIAMLTGAVVGYSIATANRLTAVHADAPLDENDGNSRSDAR